MGKVFKPFSAYTEQEKAEWNKAVSEAPPQVQEVMKKYPPGDYIIKAGAPYGICCPGTVVETRSYAENGMISIIVWAENKLPQAIQHEKMLGKQEGKTDEEIQRFHEGNVMLYIDPIWLDYIN